MFLIHTPGLAHRDLYAADILHRDISLYNILLGDKDDHLVEDPIFGFLIDLDMAIFHSCPRDDVSAQTATVSSLVRFS